MKNIYNNIGAGKNIKSHSLAEWIKYIGYDPDDIIISDTSDPDTMKINGSRLYSFDVSGRADAFPDHRWPYYADVWNYIPYLNVSHCELKDMINMPPVMGSLDVSYNDISSFEEYMHDRVICNIANDMSILNASYNKLHDLYGVPYANIIDLHNNPYLVTTRGMRCPKGYGISCLNLSGCNLIDIIDIPPLDTGANTLCFHHNPDLDLTFDSSRGISRLFSRCEYLGLLSIDAEVLHFAIRSMSANVLMNKTRIGTLEIWGRNKELDDLLCDIMMYDFLKELSTRCTEKHTMTILVPEESVYSWRETLRPMFPNIKVNKMTAVY